MPYLKPVERAAFNVEIQQLARKTETPGQVAYVIYAYLKLVIAEWGGSFEMYALVFGAAGEAIAEARRRLLGPYEDAKRAENGDVDL